MATVKKLSIGEISDLTGVSRRTVRYYVQRRLIPPPLGAGRGHYYTGEHLDRLLTVKLLQERGLSLEDIDRQLSGTGGGPPVIVRASFAAAPSAMPSPAPDGRRQAPPDAGTWTRLRIADGIELHIEARRPRPSPGTLLSLLRAVREIMGDPQAPHDGSPGEERTSDEG